MDYLDKLGPKEKEWLNNFMEEYNNATFKKGRKHLHKDKKSKSICYGINNRRNKDEYARAKARHLLQFGVDIETLYDNNLGMFEASIEDQLIEYLDNVEDSKKSSDDQNGGT